MIQRKGIELFIPYCDGPFYVDYSYSPATPDVLTCRNGDPGEPGEPADVDFQKIAARPEGDDLYEILSESAIDNLIDAVIEYEESQSGSDWEPEYESDDFPPRDYFTGPDLDMEDK